MPPVTYSYDPPERFVAGTVGPPGQRTFFLQARAATRITSVVLEKQQVEVLAERLDELLDEVMSSETDTTVPAVAPLELTDDAPLEQPIVEDFRAGTMTLSWDAAAERVVIEVFPVTETAEVDEEGEVVEVEPEEVLLVRLEPRQARAFCTRSEKVVSAGRSACPFCGEPIDPAGHLCVRANGFRRTSQVP